MNEKTKKRLTVFALIVGAFIILWLLLRRSPGNTVVNQSGDIAIPNVEPISLPPTPGANPKGALGNTLTACSFCMPGFVRNTVITQEPAPAPSPIQIVRTFIQRVLTPSSVPMLGVLKSNTSAYSGLQYLPSLTGR